MKISENFQKCFAVAAFALILSVDAAVGQGASNPFVRPETAPVAAPQTQISCPPPPGVAIPIRCWSGLKFIVLPRKEEFHGVAYPKFSTDSGDPVPYSDIAGKIITVTGVEYHIVDERTKTVEGVEYHMWGVSPTGQWTVRFVVDDSGKTYSTVSKTNTSTPTLNPNPPRDLVWSDDPDMLVVDQIALLADLQKARDQYLGKHVWIQKSALPALDSSSELKFPKFGAVTITDVLASDDTAAPVRIVVKNPKGQEGYADIAMSMTNGGYKFLDTHPLFSETFSVSDPKTKYKWSARTWSAIADEKVFIGMTQEQARMSWGSPDDINRTTGYGHVHEQWVYGSSYLHFDNGLLQSMQN